MDNCDVHAIHEPSGLGRQAGSLGAAANPPKLDAQAARLRESDRMVSFGERMAGRPHAITFIPRRHCAHDPKIKRRRMHRQIRLFHPLRNCSRTVYRELFEPAVARLSVSIP